ncbi:hypothetical protein C9426_28540 [Serratia sp. S1B]|nr:hypothetical protein C9426_28540 [Serratia sp. S1B]
MKIYKIVLLMVIGLTCSSAVAVPASFITKYYEANSNQEEGGWLQSKAPGFIYNVCLDKPLSAQQSIVVMCGNGDEDNNYGASAGYFDIWYLDGDKPVAHSLMIQSAGRHGTSGDAAAVLVGKNRWAVVLQSGLSLQGYTEEFNSYYVKSGNKVINVATFPSYLDNSGACDRKDPEDTTSPCVVNELTNQAQFIESDSDFFTMKITSKGESWGKKIEKEYLIDFDNKKMVYSIPAELQIDN